MQEVNNCFINTLTLMVFKLGNRQYLVGYIQWFCKKPLFKHSNGSRIYAWMSRAWNLLTDGVTVLCCRTCCPLTGSGIARISHFMLGEINTQTLFQLKPGKGSQTLLIHWGLLAWKIRDKGEGLFPIVLVFWKNGFNYLQIWLPVFGLIRIEVQCVWTSDL